MLSSYFINLFEYDSTVNFQLLNLLRELPSTDVKTRSIFSHILSAKVVWIKRLQKQSLSGIEIWPDLTWDECEVLIQENRKTYRSYLEGKSDDDLKSLLQYQNSKGKEFSTPIRDILMHVIIHGGYHRGQIARAVRQSGNEPINTDYITYVRSLE